MLYHRRPKIIIVGSGRSGTSTVAKLCHERLGVCMGHILKIGDYLNPSGYYEDWISHSMVQMMVNNHSFSIDTYMEAMNFQHRECLAWGAKDPWFLFLDYAAQQKLDPHLVIICDRNIDSTVKSWLKVWQASNPGQDYNQHPQVIQHYTNLTQERQRKCEAIKGVWKNYLTINFDTQQEEYKIVERIQAKLEHE